MYVSFLKLKIVRNSGFLLLQEIYMFGKNLVFPLWPKTLSINLTEVFFDQQYL